MKLFKTATLITFMFMCRLGYSDLIVPGAKKDCSQLHISDETEAAKMMDMLTVKAKEEKIKDGDKTILVTTKQMKLGTSTEIICNKLTQDGNVVHSFRGMHPGCTVSQSPASGKAGEAGGPQSGDPGAKH